MTTGSLIGRRVLVVEDEILIAMIIEEALQELGCIVVGPVATLNEAMTLAASEALDAAVLDVSIRGGQVYPVAEQLLERGVPFVLASGYGDWALPERLREQARLVKPFDAQALEVKIRDLCGRAQQPETSSMSP